MVIKKGAFDIKQFMEYMSIGRTKAYQLVKDPSFYPAFRVGGKVLISREKLDKWIDEQTIIVED